MEAALRESGGLKINIPRWQSEWFTHRFFDVARTVVAARAAKRARSGGWGGGAWVGPAHSKKEGCLDWLFFPPPTALWELDPGPPGQRD